MPAADDHPTKLPWPKVRGVKDSTSKSAAWAARSTRTPSPPTWTTAAPATTTAPTMPRTNWKKSVTTTPHSPATPA